MKTKEHICQVYDFVSIREAIMEKKEEEAKQLEQDNITLDLFTIRDMILNGFDPSSTEDLIKYGLIPEFIGRLPLVASIDNLSRDDLIKILTKPKNALLKQYAKMFELDNVELVFKESALRAVAEKALKRASGARGLRAVMEEVLLDVMFEIPSNPEIEKCIINKEAVTKNMPATLVKEEKDVVSI